MVMLKQRSRLRGGVSSSRNHRLALSAAGRLSPALLLLRGVSGSDVVTASAAAAATTVADSSTVDWVKFSEEQAANDVGASSSSSHLRQRSIVAAGEYDWAAAADRQVDSNNTSKNSGEQRILTQLKKRSSCTSLPCGECEGDCDRNSDCAVSMKKLLCSVYMCAALYKRLTHHIPSYLFFTQHNDIGRSRLLPT